MYKGKNTILIFMLDFAPTVVQGLEHPPTSQKVPVQFHTGRIFFCQNDWRCGRLRKKWVPGVSL